MNHISMILSVLLTLSLVVVIAPNILAMNRGKVLRNLALWLAIFLALGLVYQNFGPLGGGPMFGQYGQSPLNGLNGSVTSHTQENPALDSSTMPSSADDNDKDDDNSSKGSQGFSPPRE